MKHNRIKYVTTTERIFIRSDFYGNDSIDYCYVPILKNAHTWGVRFFSECCDFKKTENYADKKYIVFLRDPIDRWITGISEWFLLNKPDQKNFNIDTFMFKILCEAVKLDGHTDTQYSFLKGLDNTKFTFFDVDDENFELNVKHFAHKQLRCRFPKHQIGKIYPTEDSSYKKSIVDQLKHLVKENPQMLQNIKTFYNIDYDSMRSLHFYTADGVSKHKIIKQW